MKMINKQTPALVLTGASGFLGETLLPALCESWHVLAIDLKRPTFQSDALTFIPFDLSDINHFDDLKDTIRSKTDNLKSLINNAAFNPKVENGTNNFVPFEQYSLQAWEAEVRLNLSAPIFLIQKLMPLFNHADQNRCKVINVTSMYGTVTPNQMLYKTTETESASKPMGYPVTKAALDMATKYLAVHLAKQNFNVNAIAPGGIFNGNDELFLGAYAKLSPMGRMAEPTEMIEAFKFLLGVGSDYMCGHTLAVDGGWTIW